MKTGIEQIAAERLEQIEKHGRTLSADATVNKKRQLHIAAARLLSGEDLPPCPAGWNLSVWGKMCAKPTRERLVLAGALIAAELDRLNAE